MNKGTKKRILLADNSPEYRRSVRHFLELEDYAVAEVGSSEEAQEKLEKEQFDLVLVDLRLQDDDDANDSSGLAVAKFASGLGIPAIIITTFPSVELARTALRSRGAESYAQDLIAKASGPQALLDSIRLVLKPTQYYYYPFGTGGLFLDLEKKLVKKGGKYIKLSPKQYSLLEELYKKDGGVVTYTELIRAIYGENVSAEAARQDRRLRNLIDRTKASIEEPDTTYEYLQTLPGRGLRFSLSGFAGDPTTDAPPPEKKKKGK